MSSRQCGVYIKMGLTMAGAGVNPAYLFSVKTQLKEKFSSCWEDLEQLLRRLGEERSVDPNWLYIYLLAEAWPVAFTHWPKSWVSCKRVESWFVKLPDFYWEALRVVSLPEWFMVQGKWMILSGMAPSKLLRVIGSSVPIVKVYVGGRWVKDLLVVAWFAKRDKLTVDAMVRNLLTRMKGCKEVTPLLVWKWNQYHPEGDVVKESSVKGVGMLEVG